MKNRYGVDSSYFTSKLALVIRDIADYTPDELARELARLSATADSNVLAEDEFQPLGRSEQLPAKPIASMIHAVKGIDNFDGEKNHYFCLATVDKSGRWISAETGNPLITREGEAILEWWPLYPGTGNKEGGER